MQSGVKPKATDDPHDFVVVPSDQVRVAPSDAEITDLLRAAARHHSEASTRAASDSSTPSTVPTVDTTFRATDVNADVPVRSSFGRRALRALAALLLTLGIGAAALSWQTFSYAGKKALLSWVPTWAIAASLPLEKLGLGKNSTPSDDPADVPPAEAAAPVQSTADNTAPSDAAASSVATAPPDPAQQLQSMARDLANANQQVETLKASIVELKASQQQMARDFANKLAEQTAKAKIAAAAPRPAPAAHRPAPVYSSTSYASPPTQAAPPPAYRPTTSPYGTQASVASAPPAGAAQPYVPPPVQIQPQADPGVVGSAPRPPMPLSQ
jgi:hypothetical protein